MKNIFVQIRIRCKIRFKNFRVVIDDFGTFLIHCDDLMEIFINNLIHTSNDSQAH